MKSLCRSLLSNGKFKFRCPGTINNTSLENRTCNIEWPYFLVRHVACLSSDEMYEFDKMISENYLNREAGRQQCPSCSVWGFRKDTTTNCSICSFCSAQLGKTFMFCWCCLNDWKTSDRLQCGNADCDGRDKRIRILSDCPMRKIANSSSEIPSMRGCPSCGSIIEHKEYCSHMTCVCGFAFCFRCLKPMTTQVWECAAYGDSCTVAPRQTSLPG